MTASTFNSCIAALFPPARRRVRTRDVLPLIVFGVLFGGVCAWLEFTNRLLFASPKAFLILITLPWVWWLHVTGFSGLAGFRSLLALITRMLLIGVFAMTLAEPRAVRKSDDLAVMYALDVSDSVGDATSEQALSYIVRTASEKPERDKAGLVVFGRDAGVELPPRLTFPFEAVNCRIARDATNLEDGLALAAAMLPEEDDGRIVLVSDGTQTEGSYPRVLQELTRRRIAVDVLPIAYDYDHEVWLEKLELPDFVKLGETYNASIILASLSPGAGDLVLKENGEAISRQTVTFQAGKNRYTLPLYLREPGYYEYVATIEPSAGRDGWAENNTAINYLYIKGEGKVLVAVTPDGDPRDWQAFVRALRKGKRDVEVASAYEFPRNALSLLAYDCIVFVNVAADAFDVVQLDALRDAVYHQGSGFLMIGGPNSFGPGGYHRSKVEEILPVTMDITQKKVLPKGALAVILHTCEFPEGNTWGKRIAKEAIRVLGAKDEVGILAYTYEGGASWLFELTPAGEYERLAKLVNQAQIGDMPSFSDTMRLGLDALKASDAATKHMIIISDGDPSPPPPNMVNEFVMEKVSVSMVAVFPHGGQDISIMRSIAATTGGRYYLPQDPSLLPSIFIKEAKTLRRSMIQNEEFTPRVELPSPIIKGIDGFPQLRGYVLTTPKPRSSTILRGPSDEDLDPVLTTWRYGLGKTAAFTSDLSPNWASSWLEWERFMAFIRQLVTDISRVQQQSSLHLSAFAAGTSGVVVIEDHFPGDSFLDVRAQVGGPRDRDEAIAIRQTGPRRYEGQFELWGRGRYRITAAAAGEGRQERALGGFAVPYSPEYLRFRSNPLVLKDIARRTGGRLLTGDERGRQIFPEERQTRSATRPVVAWFLLALACLVPIDVGVRRVQLDWAVIRGWLGLDRGKQPSGETFAALLKRKQDIAFATKDKAQTEGMSTTQLRARRDAARRDERERRPDTRPSRTRAEPEAAATEEQQPTSTTARLLARKKKWKDER